MDRLEVPADLARGESGPADDEAVPAMTRMLFGHLLRRAMLDRDTLHTWSPAQRAEEATYVVALLLRLLSR